MLETPSLQGRNKKNGVILHLVFYKVSEQMVQSRFEDNTRV